jgi:hypothetical protein
MKYNEQFYCKCPKSATGQRMEMFNGVGKENLEENIRANVWKYLMAWESKILRKLYGPTCGKAYWRGKGKS